MQHGGGDTAAGDTSCGRFSCTTPFSKLLQYLFMNLFHQVREPSIHLGHKPCYIYTHLLSCTIIHQMVIVNNNRSILCYISTYTIHVSPHETTKTNSAVNQLSLYFSTAIISYWISLFNWSICQTPFQLNFLTLFPWSIFKLLIQCIHLLIHYSCLLLFLCVWCWLRATSLLVPPADADCEQYTTQNSSNECHQ